ncbi:MAG TPA: chemotaxis protein CheW [Burkholderiaceae bacterium]|nr:chemotaxis protein CheW [Burkholderiaceae bacterium]
MNALVQSPSGNAMIRPTRVAPPGQYLTFMQGGELFAIGILAIKEIIQFQGVTTVPMMPECIRGVINLRGAVVPVVDLPARFGRPGSEVTKRSCIVIVEVEAADECHVIGVMVDAVSEVLEIAAADIEPAPTFGTRIRSDFILGMGKVQDRFVILLDANQVLAIDPTIETLGHAAAPDTSVLLA